MKYTGYSNEELWRRSERGDRAAMDTLARRLLPTVHRLASQYASRLDDARGIAYEAMMDAIAGYDPEASYELGAYVAMRVRHSLSHAAKCYLATSDYSLDEAVEPEPSEGEDDDECTFADTLCSPTPSPEEEVLERDKRLFVRMLLSQLPDAHRRVLVLEHLYELNRNQIAVLLDVTPGRVTQLYNQALTFARAMIA